MPCCVLVAPINKQNPGALSLAYCCPHTHTPKKHRHAPCTVHAPWCTLGRAPGRPPQHSPQHSPHHATAHCPLRAHASARPSASCQHMRQGKAPGAVAPAPSMSTDLGYSSSVERTPELSIASTVIPTQRRTRNLLTTSASLRISGNSRLSVPPAPTVVKHSSAGPPATRRRRRPSGLRRLHLAPRAARCVVIPGEGTHTKLRARPAC